MNYRFSDASNHTPKSFIREILKLTQSEDIISFAGGLPNKAFFPVKALQEATDKVLVNDGANSLQYSTTEGYLPLREMIAARYAARGVNVDVNRILITTGSQQALDLLGKVFLNKDDCVCLERPSYLGAIQAFQMFQPRFQEVDLSQDGIDLPALEQEMQRTDAKFFYGIPNFQNPTGLTYSLQSRQALGEYLQRSGNIMVEDDPYGELRFIGEHLPNVYAFAPDNVVLLGSFSKICAPGLRLGWMVAHPEIMERLVTAKQASDLHTPIFNQRIMAQYMQDNPLDEHIQTIRDAYFEQRMAMVAALHEYMPEGVTFTEPEGGMFLWISLPKNCPAMTLFPIAVKNKVAFVPGEPFSTEGNTSYDIRLSFCGADAATIKLGVQRLAAAISELTSESTNNSNQTVTI